MPPRDDNVAFRVTSAEKESIRAASNKAGSRTISAFARAVVIKTAEGVISAHSVFNSEWLNRFRLFMDTLDVVLEQVRHANDNEELIRALETLADLIRQLERFCRSTIGGRNNANDNW